MFQLLMTLSNLPSTFGGVAGVILKIICQLAKEVHLICDTYKSPSVKDIERELRGSTESNIAITGSDQKRPKDFTSALSSG